LIWASECLWYLDLVYDPKPKLKRFQIEYSTIYAVRPFWDSNTELEICWQMAQVSKINGELFFNCRKGMSGQRDVPVDNGIRHFPDT